MRLGVHYANFTHPDWEHRLAERLTETARVADQGGVAQFTVMDHWFQMEVLGGPPEPMLEGYTTLGYLAAVTERRPAQPARHRRHLPPPGPARQDRDHPRRALGRPGDARHRRRVVRPRARRPRRAVPVDAASGSSGSRRRSRSSGRCGRATPAPYAGTHYQLAEPVNVPPPVQHRPRRS